MAYLKQHMDYKQVICQKLINLPNIVNAIDSTKSDEPDLLLWQNIFPTYINPNVIEEKKVFITLEIYSRKNRLNPVCVDTIVEINIFADIDIQRTESGYVRTDFIQSEIFEAFDKNTLDGVGYLEFEDEKPINVGDKYSGSKLFYSITNLKRLS